MFENGHLGISLAHLLILFSALICVIYGISNWNRGGEKEQSQIQEEAQWEKEEEKIESNL